MSLRKEIEEVMNSAHERKQKEYLIIKEEFLKNFKTNDERYLKILEAANRGEWHIRLPFSHREMIFLQDEDFYFRNIDNQLYTRKSEEDCYNVDICWH